ILITSRQTRIQVDGNMENCSFSGQNLHAGDVTSINVNGRIFNRGFYSSVILSQGIKNLPPTSPNSPTTWSTVLSAALNPLLLPDVTAPATLDPSKLAAFALQSAALFPSGNPGFIYEAATRKLLFGGQMSQSVFDALQQPLTVLRYGPDGFPMLDA